MNRNPNTTRIAHFLSFAMSGYDPSGAFYLFDLNGANIVGKYSGISTSRPRQNYGNKSKKCAIS
jgi:hypothetical protein